MIEYFFKVEVKFFFHEEIWGICDDSDTKSAQLVDVGVGDVIVVVYGGLDDLVEKLIKHS